MGTLHEDGILGGAFSTPPSRTPLSLDVDVNRRFPTKKRKQQRQDKHMRKLMTAAFRGICVVRRVGKGPRRGKLSVVHYRRHANP
jgi:hypothetical protein